MSSTESADAIGRAAVLGAGTMGHGIAHVLAMCGIEVSCSGFDYGRISAGLILRSRMRVAYTQVAWGHEGLDRSGRLTVTFDAFTK